MMFVGFALNFFTLIYQFFKLVEATSGPVNICFNCLSFMLGKLHFIHIREQHTVLF